MRVFRNGCSGKQVEGSLGTAGGDGTISEKQTMEGKPQAHLGTHATLLYMRGRAGVLAHNMAKVELGINVPSKGRAQMTQHHGRVRVNALRTRAHRQSVGAARRQQ